MLVERDRLMVLVIVGRRTDEHCFRREVGIGSKSQLISGESVIVVCEIFLIKTRLLEMRMKSLNYSLIHLKLIVTWILSLLLS